MSTPTESAESVDHEKHRKLSIFREIPTTLRGFQFQGFTEKLTSLSSGILGIVAVVLGVFFLTPIGGDLPEMCAFKTSTDLPCPGCGLTRSVTSFLHLEFWMALNYHPLGFVFAIGFLMMAPMAFLTPTWRRKLREKLKPRDQVFGRSFLIFAMTMFLFGFARMILISYNAPGFQWWNKDEVPPFAVHYAENLDEIPAYAPKLYLELDEE